MFFDTVVLFPNCPTLLYPQLHAVPLLSIANERLLPVDILQNVFTDPFTDLGTNGFKFCPNWPTELKPQDHPILL